MDKTEELLNFLTQAENQKIVISKRVLLILIVSYKKTLVDLAAINNVDADELFERDWDIAEKFISRYNDNDLQILLKKLIEDVNQS